MRTTENRKSKSEFYDPCQEAAQRSYKCLYRNGGDKSMCGEYFQCVCHSTTRDVAGKGTKTKTADTAIDGL